MFLNHNIGPSMCIGLHSANPGIIDLHIRHTGVVSAALFYAVMLQVHPGPSQVDIIVLLSKTAG